MCTTVSVPELVATIPSRLILDLFTKTSASILSEALLQLNTAERLVLSLNYFLEFSVREVASVMKVEEQVAVEIHARAVSSLSKLVAGKHEQAR